MSLSKINPLNPNVSDSSVWVPVPDKKEENKLHNVF